MFTSPFAALVGIANLGVASELVDQVALAHDLHKLLFDQPDRIPFDVVPTYEYSVAPFLSAI